MRFLEIAFVYENSVCVCVCVCVRVCLPFQTAFSNHINSQLAKWCQCSALNQWWGIEIAATASLGLEVEYSPIVVSYS